MNEKYMIRYARADDRLLVKTLWATCFPDEDAFTNYFFERLYDPSRALLCVREDGHPAAMLHMLAHTMMWLGHEVPVTYVFGVGAHPDLRRRGLASGLLDQALFEMHLRGTMFSVLIPQEDWLFGFYRTFGYAPVFMQPSRTYTFAETPRPADENDIPLLCSLYEKALAGRPHLLRTPEHWHDVLQECVLGGGQVLMDGVRGYAVFPQAKSAPTECFGPGAQETGPESAFGCLRIVDAVRVCALLRQAGHPVPEGVLDDPFAPWNVDALGSESKTGTALDIAEFASCLFAENPPYMQLMHN